MGGRAVTFDSPIFDRLELHSVTRADEFGGPSGWIIALHAPDGDTLRAVLDRWGPT